MELIHVWTYLDAREMLVLICAHRAVHYSTVCTQKALHAEEAQPFLLVIILIAKNAFCLIM